MLQAGDLGVYRDAIDAAATPGRRRRTAAGDGGIHSRRTPTPVSAGATPRDHRRRPLSLQKSSNSNRDHHLSPASDPSDLKAPASALPDHKTPVPAPPSTPSPTLCSDCSRAASREAVCFIGNDGRVSACSARMALRLCKNLNCAASNPDYATTITSSAPKKYLVSKRHQLTYGVTNNKHKSSSNNKSSPSANATTTQSPSSPLPSSLLQESKLVEISRQSLDAEDVADNFSTFGGLSFESGISERETCADDEGNGCSASQLLKVTTNRGIVGPHCFSNMVCSIGEKVEGSNCSLSGSNVIESEVTSTYEEEEGDKGSSCRRKEESSYQKYMNDEASSWLHSHAAKKAGGSEMNEGSGRSTSAVCVKEGGECGGWRGRGATDSGRTAAAEEKVNLRKGHVQGRKQAEEWMLDHAMEGAVQKLSCPSASGKVKLLVKAFEAVIISASASGSSSNGPDGARHSP